MLNLINEILDLSKVEAGKMEIDVTNVAVAEVQEYVERTFRSRRRSEGPGFTIDIEPDVPVIIRTDMQRLQQVLKNLLSNAFKFTEHGRVDLRIAGSDRDVILDTPQLFPARRSRSRSPTRASASPGISRSLIFEAFQQADGTTNRRYGGTGLGLSISREITRLLGGRIDVDSTPGRGSTFTLFLPQHYAVPCRRHRRDHPAIAMTTACSADSGSSGYAASARSRARWARAPIDAAPRPSRQALLTAGAPPIAPPEVRDDRADLEPGDRVLLIVEDDVSFAGILLDMVRQQGFKGLVALQAKTDWNWRGGSSRMRSPWTSSSPAWTAGRFWII